MHLSAPKGPPTDDFRANRTNKDQAAYFKESGRTPLLRAQPYFESVLFLGQKPTIPQSRKNIKINLQTTAKKHKVGMHFHLQ